MSPYAYTFTKKKPSTYKFNRIPDMDRLSINDLHVNQDEDVGEKLVKEKEIYYQVEKSWVNEQQKNS